MVLAEAEDEDAPMGMVLHHVASEAAVEDAEALLQFQQQWPTYRKLVEFDGLSHRAVGARLHRALRDCFSAPFALLDVACGDAEQMRSVLDGTTISRYRGIDLSKPALALAEKNLAAVPFAVELDHCDFVEALERRPKPVDAAWCGLSIHHLKIEAKRAVFAALRRCTGSVLMIYEPTLAVGEDRAGYLARFRRLYRPAWTFFSEAEWDQLYDHVSRCDWPESAETWLALGRDAGFRRARALFRDPAGLHVIYRYDV
jgi:Methyltransferase domain